MKFALGHGSIPEEAAGDVRLSTHFIRQQLIRQCKADRDGEAAAYHRIAAVEPCLSIEQVHRSAAPAATTFLLTKHFRHDRTGRHPSRQSMAVLAIRGHDGVLGPQSLHYADTHGLLADVQMQESADFLLRVQFGALLFEAADQEHLAE